MKQFTLALLLAVGISAQTLPQGMTKVTSVEGITEYKLANGLRVLIFPDPSKTTATVNITYLVGSRQEGAGERGMAHLLEHMLFKGSTKHTNIPQELTEHGSRPNGTTSWDRTNYFETFQATDENLKWALDLESDRMVNSFIRKSDWDSEYTVVRNEFEMGENNPIGVLFERALSAAYIWHPYGHSPIGARSDIENVPIERLQAFYHKYYQPDNAVLTVAGNIEESKVLALIAEDFGPIPAPSRKLEIPYTVEPPQDGEREVTLRRVGTIQALLDVYHVPSGSDPDFPAIDVLVGILTDNPSGRLYKALVDNKKASEVIGFDQQLNEPGTLILGAVLNQQQSLDEARKILLDTVDNMIKEPPSREEVERAKQHQLKDIELQLRNSEQIGLFLSEWASMGDWRLLFLDRDRLRKVTPEDVSRVAKAYLKSSNRTLAEFIPDPHPDRSVIPAKVDLAAELKNYHGDAAMAQGEAFDPSPANIESRTLRSKLDNGMKLALLSKKTRGASVNARLALHYGTIESLKGRETAASLAFATLMRGTQKMNRQQIQDELDRLKARVRINGGAAGATVTIETVRENFPDVLRLVAEILRQPAFPASEFEQIRTERITGEEANKSEPQALAMAQFGQILYPHPEGDVRRSMMPEEQIAALKAATLEDAKKFYRDFVGASNAEFAAVGDFDSKQIAALMGELFGNWKSPAAFARVTDPYQKIPPSSKTIETPDKENAMFMAGLRLNISTQDADYAPLVLANYMLGGGFLNSRLAVRIRQKEGLSYGIGSGFSADPKVKNGALRIYAIAAPQNMAKVERATREEIEKAVKDGFTPEEIAAAKSGFLQSRKVDRSEDAGLAALLTVRDYDDRTLAYDAELEKKIAALTPAEIQEAMRRNLDASQLVVVKAGDFSKMKSQ
ncbi:MAG TPA: pitrilysin family protein [Bryobacteraceae bacterium]|jgi:zinc protease|nr:pitrilysin family protein [Bryobacteraceae bacterium]